ncbi:MAG: hypothetical protein Q9227_001336 [Pyrenula ochraceoflavens]
MASPYGPFVKTGRGGAGNFSWRSESQQQREPVDVPSTIRLCLPSDVCATQDLESQQPEQFVPLSIPNEEHQNRYVPAGRGGAGNYTVESEDSKALHRAPEEMALNSTRSQMKAPMFSGRGGAGNHEPLARTMGDLESNPQLGIDDELKKEGLTRKVEQHVERGLRQPDHAYIPVPEGKEASG